MRQLTDNGKSRVPFEFHDKMVTLKVTRYTTFHDVVHMLTHKAGITKSTARLYAVYECTKDLEKKIGGEVRVLKMCRSWGCEISNFRFVVKHHDNNLFLKDFNRSSTANSEEEIANLLSQSYTEAISNTLIRDTSDFKASTSPKSKQFKNDQVYKNSITNNRRMSLAKVASKLDSTTSSSVGIPSKTDCRPAQRNNDCFGKGALLVKYFKDLKIFSKWKSKKTSQALGKRERADDAEVPEVHSGRYFEHMDDPDVPTRSYLDNTHTTIANSNYLWEKHCNDFDNDSETSDDFIDRDKENDVSNTSSSARNVRALDTAFVHSSRSPEIDEGIDVMSIASVDLNTAFVAEFERHSASDKAYNEHVYNVDDFENNVYIRTLFGAKSVSSQDDEVDSFMRSRLDSF